MLNGRSHFGSSPQRGGKLKFPRKARAYAAMEAPGDLPGLLDRCLQLAFEMNIPYGGYLDEAVETWLRGAKEERELLQRARGVYGTVLDWHLLQPTSSSTSATEVVIPKPDPGARPTHTRGTAMESTDRETRLQDIWCARLREELEICGAPVLATLESSLDPGRAIAMLAGRTRVTTLKRYVTVFQQWRLWLLEAKQIVPPGRPSDLVNYLLARRDEPCGRSIPELIMKAICWMEKVAEFPIEQRATQGRLAWAIKDRIVESLSSGAPLTKRAPRFPVVVLARLEELVLDDMYAVGWRIWAWIKLVWASLRWSDIQAILPQELHLIEGRLSTVLRRTKTSGPNRQVKELPVCVSEKAYFAKPTWVKAGFDLLQLHVRYKRDYLVPRLKGNGALDNRMASYADAMVATAQLLSAIQLPQVTQGYWTEHSERAVIPTQRTEDKNILGRWKPEGSDTYAKVLRGAGSKATSSFCRGCREFQTL